MALIIDGHESHASRKQRCSGCLERRIETKNGVKTEFYHRNVTALLVGKDFELLIDAEAQHPGEDEVATALRLLDRVFEVYPRAFDLVAADAQYTDRRFYDYVLSRKKHVLTVLKDNQPTLLKEARALLSLSEPVIFEAGRRRLRVWDGSGFSLSTAQDSLRVVRSFETRTVRRQLDRKEDDVESDWFWLTSLPPDRVDSLAVVELGHTRWAIENQGFNETVNRWAADHVYRHDPTAILAFWLLCMLSFNLFQAFFARNLKPVLRRKVTRVHIAERIKAELYAALPAAAGLPP
jgi:hypothetical protein